MRARQAAERKRQAAMSEQEKDAEAQAAWAEGQERRKKAEAMTPEEENAERDELEKLAKEHEEAFTKKWDEWAPQRKYAAKLKTAKGQADLLKVLITMISVPPAMMEDRWPRWVNCESGLVSLEPPSWVPEQGRWRAGIYPHDPAARTTYCVRAKYVPGPMQCPMFWRMLLRVCGGDPAVAEYLLKCLGYALLGENPEQVIFFLNGPTKSGKSQLLYIVSQVLGETLAHESQSDLICVVRHGRNARTENSIRGKRFITITETSQFKHVDEAQVKRLTGEPVISVDRHYAKEELRTPATFTMFIATNEMPSLTNFDAAMKERVIVIPCGDTIPAHQRDKRLAEKILATERDGIFSLLVKACREYHRTRLSQPHAVVMETEKYQGEQNTVANFLADFAMLVPPNEVTGIARVPMPQAWDYYRRWSRGETHLGRNEFYEHMARQPGVTRVDNGGSVRVFEGFFWKPEAAPEKYGESRNPEDRN